MAGRVDVNDKAKASSWEPGDQIPGWDDFDCGAAYRDSGHLSVDSLHVYSGSIRMAILAVGDESGRIDGREIGFLATDCDESDCGDPVDWDDTGVPYAWVNLRDDIGDVVGRGQGWYGPNANAADFTLGATMNLPFGYFINDLGHYDNMAGMGCLSRVRPDMITGFVTFTIEDSFYDHPSPWYPAVSIVLPFSVTFVDHEELDSPTDGYERPAGAELVTYEVYDYDATWPWDEITDPAIREAVYERYKPWNLP
jgi:hypothetical protein